MKVDRRTALTGALAGGAAALLPAPLLARGTVAASTRWGEGFEGQRKADLGDGTFLNPIVAGDHPDPTILKDGADYYMTFSTFDSYPGLVIWHSRDLVNWRPVTAALTRNIGSVWAPELIKHQGRYFLYIPVEGISQHQLRHLGGPDRGAVERSHRSRAAQPYRPRPRRRRGRLALAVPLRRRPGAALRRRAQADRRARACLRSVALSVRLGRRRLLPRGAEDHPPWRLFLPDHRGRRNGRAAHRPHGDRRALALDPRPLGELPEQPSGADDRRSRTLVVARARHSGRGAGGRLVDGLSRL